MWLELSTSQISSFEMSILFSFTLLVNSLPQEYWLEEQKQLLYYMMWYADVQDSFWPLYLEYKRIEKNSIV